VFRVLGKTGGRLNNKNVVVLHAFTEAEALAWLRSQPGGKIETSIAELTRLWRWSRARVTARLKQWADAGTITRSKARSGRSLITALGAEATAAAAGSVEPAQAIPAARRRNAFRFIGGTVLAAIAVGIAWFGLQINAWYGASLGKTTEAGMLLAGLSVAADILALILPAAACALWFERHRAAALTAWAVWTMTIAITLMASIGFASLNIADTIAARAKIAAESGGLSARIERLRGERAAIAETRAVAAIEADLQRAQPGAATVWRQTAGCTDVTLAASGAACADVLRLRQALATAQRRDALDAELRQAEAKLAALPAVAASDPQTEAAARLINWASFGMTRISAHDIDMARVAGMTLLPQISGLVLMLAMVLWQPARRTLPSPASGGGKSMA
jgi:hypothetical protein